MDQRKLIALVKKRRALWDKTTPEYHSRGLTRKYWNEVAKLMNETEFDCRRKWRGLRDTYNKELAKIKTKKNSGAATDPDFKSRWIYFDQMHFIKSNLTHQKKLPAPIAASPKLDDLFACDDTFGDHDLSNSSNDDLQQQQAANAAKELENDPNFYCYFPEETKKPLDAIDGLLRGVETAPPSLDDDYHFALSIVPYMRRLPTHRKLRLRTRFQKLLQREHEAAERGDVMTQSGYVSTATASPPLLQDIHQEISSCTLCD